MAAALGVLVKMLGLNKPQVKTMVISFGVGIVIFHIVWVCGWLKVLGLPSPFASSGDLQQLTQVVNKLSNKETTVVTQLKQSRKDQLEESIFLAEQDRCKAKKDPERQDFDAQNIENLTIKYEHLVGTTPTVPGCN